MDLIKNSSDLERVAATEHESDEIFDQIHSTYREKLKIEAEIASTIEILLIATALGIRGQNERTQRISEIR